MPELFVDASAAPGGDGSRERPFRAISEAPRHGRLRLAAGVYPGGMMLEDIELVGGPAVVLAAAPPATCVRTRGAVRLERVQIQGGAAGVVVEGGRAVLAAVSLSGQRGPAVEVATGAELLLTDSTVQASVSALPGVRILEGGKAELVQVRFQGPFRRAVDATQPAALRLRGVRTQDALTACWASRRARRSWRGWRSAAGRGPWLYVAGATVQLRDVRDRGARVRLLTGDGRAHRRPGHALRPGAERAGLGLVKSKGTAGGRPRRVRRSDGRGAAHRVRDPPPGPGGQVAAPRAGGPDAELILDGATFRGRAA
jgi:hypothetical protein